MNFFLLNFAYLVSDYIPRFQDVKEIVIVFGIFLGVD